MDVLDNGGGLPLTMDTVKDVAGRAGVELGDTAIKIVDDPEYARYLDFQGACACTPGELGGSQIDLGPASFADGETLAATLAHEMEHVNQLRAGGVSTSTIGDLEDAAYAVEPGAVARYLATLR
jgi:hypothetical protein